MRKVLVLAALAIAEVAYGQPTISAVYVSASTSTTATIVWTTSTPATSQIRYGYDNTLPFSNNTNHTLTTSHSMMLTLLNASQPYYFAAVSVDGSSHSAQSSTYEFALCGNPQVPVSGSINQFYYSGTFSMTWNPPSGAGGTPTVCGQNVTTPVSGNLNLNGTFTTQVSDSLKVTPGPGTWTVAVADIGNISPISVTLPLSATSPDISSQLQTAAAGTSLVGVIANNISHTCWPSFVCSGVGSGITDINSQTGPSVTFQSSGSTVVVTNPSPNVINLEASGTSGVTSVNLQTGPAVNFQSSGSTVTITNPSPNIINLESTGGGVPSISAVGPIEVNNGSGPVTGAATISCPTCGSVGSSVVQYNSPTSIYLWCVGGDSRCIDDPHNLNTIYTVTGLSWNTGVCTATAANDLVAGQVFEVYNATGFGGGHFDPVSLEASGIWYGNDNGFYTVLSAGLSSTQFEFNCPQQTGTGTGTGGKIEDTTYMLPWYASKLPFFNGHGNTLLLDSGTLVNAVTEYSTLYHPYCAAATPTSPAYFITTGGYNDINANGRTAAQVEGDLTTLWTEAHTDGCIVVDATIPTNGSNYAAGRTLTIAQVNDWRRQQAKSNATVATGAYWDKIVDLASLLTNPTIHFNASNDQVYSAAGVSQAANAFNNSLSSQSTVPPASPGLISSVETGSVYFTDELFTTWCSSYGGGAERCTFTVDYNHQWAQAASISDLALGVSTSPICTTTNSVLTNVGCVSPGGISDIQITVGTTLIAANSCLPTNTTYNTATMTGLTTAMSVFISPSTDFSAVTGWTPAAATPYFNYYPTTNNLKWQICNNSSGSITPGSSTVWNVGAR